MLFNRDYTKPGHIEEKALEIGKGRRQRREENLVAQNRQLKKKVGSYRKIATALVAVGAPAATYVSDLDQGPNTQIVETEKEISKNSKDPNHFPRNYMPEMPKPIITRKNQAPLNLTPLQGPPAQKGNKKASQDRVIQTSDMPTYKPEINSSMPNILKPRS